ncbi:hypothetical protein ACJZ2D_010723 [Fusarium nematophilum]
MHDYYVLPDWERTRRVVMAVFDRICAANYRFNASGGSFVGRPEAAIDFLGRHRPIATDLVCRHVPEVETS